MRSIAAAHGLPEPLVRDSIAQLRAEWIGEYSSIEIGECIEFYRIAAEMSRRSLARPALSTSDCCGFERLALTTSERERDMLSSLGALVGPQEVISATRIRELIEAVQRAINEGRTLPAPIVPVVQNERLCELERLVGRVGQTLRLPNTAANLSR